MLSTAVCAQCTTITVHLLRKMSKSKLVYYIRCVYVCMYERSNSNGMSGDRAHTTEETGLAVIPYARERVKQNISWMVSGDLFAGRRKQKRGEKAKATVACHAIRKAIEHERTTVAGRTRDTHVSHSAIFGAN